MRYGLIGTPLGHSHSPFVHAVFGYPYELIPVEKEELKAFIAERNFDGISVTIPHKTAVIPFLDRLDETAKECGSVNVVTNDGGRLAGYNTDIFGMAYAMRAAGIGVTGKRLLILGTGGTSLTAQALARRENAASVTVVSRSGEVNYRNAYEYTETQVIINTTPVGMYPSNGAAPLDVARFPRLEGVFDAVYNPVKTRLILESEERNIKAAGGIAMLAAQAKRAAEIFTGLSFDDDYITDIQSRLLEKLNNIVLIGMPGSGKTSVGRIIAERTGRTFIDTDAEAERAENLTVPEMFAQKGESFFREAEKKAIAEATKGQGAVIAVGGGAVLDRENRRNMRQNGICVRLLRDLDALPTDNRPLSADRDALRKMAEERESYYASCADLSVINDCPERAALEIIARVLKNPVG